MSLIVGGRLCVEGCTRTEKLFELVAWPSLTVRVMVVVPVWLVSGVMVTVLLAPEPPKTILAFGTSVWLEENPANTRSPGAVSASLIVKGMGPVEFPSVIVWFGILEMKGGWFWPVLSTHLPAEPAL